MRQDARRQRSSPTGSWQQQVDGAAGKATQAARLRGGQPTEHRRRAGGEHADPPELIDTHRTVVGHEHRPVHLPPPPAVDPVPDRLAGQVPQRLAEADHLFLMEEQPGQLVGVVARQRPPPPRPALPATKAHDRTLPHGPLPPLSLWTTARSWKNVAPPGA
ncbi:hypothetical protein ACFYMB_16630 [Micromonospora haikouensis]|uniref:hypothetical protein n=1 Tax=Micromonospora haikouensis TaxID=686309 RepID=UPI0036A1712E